MYKFESYEFKNSFILDDKKLASQFKYLWTKFK